MNNNQKMILVINCPKSEYESDSKFNTIKNKLEPTMWGIDGDMETYCIRINMSTFKLLYNQFSFDFDRSDKKDGCLPYTSFLKEDEIRSMHFYDYGGEKIYRLGELEIDWSNTLSKDMLMVASKLLQYISKNQLIENSETVKKDLQSIIKISEFCVSRSIDFSIYDPYC